MPAKNFVIANRANKTIGRFPLWVQNKISKAFDKLKENPLRGEKMHGEISGKYKFRVGDYRIVYKFDSKQSLVEILKIEHRQGIYK